MWRDTVKASLGSAMEAGDSGSVQAGHDAVAPPVQRDDHQTPDVALPLLGYASRSEWPAALKTAVEIVEAAAQPMFVVWGARRSLFYNAAYAEILRERHPAALGADMLEVWPEIREELTPIVTAAYAGRAVRMDDFPLLMTRGGRTEQAHFSFSYTPLRDENGRVGGFICNCAETTDKVREERLQHAERTRQRLMLQQMPGFSAMLAGPNHRFEYVNDAYVALVGPRRLIGTDVRTAFPDLADQAFFELLDRVYKTGEPYTARAMPIGLAGEPAPRYVDFIYQPLRDETGQVTGIFVGGYDVTEQVRAEQRLKASEERFRAVQETSIDGFMILEAVRDEQDRIEDFRWIYANEAAERLAGKPRRWFLGRRLLTEMPGHRLEGLFDLYREVVDLGVAFSREVSYTHEGLDVYIRLAGTRVGDGVAISFADLSGRRRAEERLVASEREARATSRLLETIIETAPDPIWIKDLEGRIVRANSAAARVLGRPLDALIGVMDEDLTDPEHAATLRAQHETILASGRTLEVEETLLDHARGEPRIFLSTKTPLRDPGGALVGWLGIARDITELKRTEKRMQEAAERVQLALDAGAILGTWVWDIPRGVIVTDKRFARVFDLDPDRYRDGIPAAAVVAAIHPEDREPLFKAIEVCLREGSTFSSTYRIQIREHTHWVEASGKAELDDAGEARRFSGVLIDVRERRAAEHARDRATALLRTFIEAVPGVVYAKDRQGRLLMANAGTTRLIGLPPEQYLGKTDAEFLRDPAQAATIMANDRRIMDQAMAEEVEETVSLPNGEVLVWLSTKSPLFDEDGKVVGLVGASIDITRRKAAEAALTESREDLRRLNQTLEQRVAQATAERDQVWRNSRDLLLVLDADGVIRAASPSWSPIMGHAPEALAGRRITTLAWPEDATIIQDALARAAAGEALTDFECRLRHLDGGFRWLSWNTAVEGGRIYGYGRDITEVKLRQAELAQAQEALRQSQKLESMGQLTGGVAHDFNNLLMPIIAALDMLGRQAQGDERSRRLIDGALKSAERAKTLVQRLLAFARRQPLQPAPVYLPELVRNMADLIASTSGPRVRVCMDMADDLPPVRADPNQLEMAILNLAVNARDAMPEGGELSISARSATLGHEGLGGLAAGGYVRLAVADTGLGMDEETIAKSIEPFFSTKGIGKGTGLGLSMVHGLAAQLGGQLKIESRLGAGTKVELWLPVTEPGLTAELAAGPSPLAPGAGLVLLVDDEELVREATSDMLSDCGYRVISVDSAEAALQRIEEGLVPDLILSDHLMPGMSGVDLARRLGSLLPSVPVLIMSGYARDEGLATDLPRLNKPFRQTELAARLASLTATASGPD